MSEKIGRHDVLYLFASHLQWHTERKLALTTSSLQRSMMKTIDIRRLAERRSGTFELCGKLRSSREIVQTGDRIRVPRWRGLSDAPLRQSVLEFHFNERR